MTRDNAKSEDKSNFLTSEDLESKYFVIEKSNFYYFLGGALVIGIGYLFAMFQISESSLRKSVEQVLKDSGVKQSIAAIKESEKTAESYAVSAKKSDTELNQLVAGWKKNELASKFEEISNRKYRLITAAPMVLTGYQRSKSDGEYLLNDSTEPSRFKVPVSHTFKNNDKIIGAWWVASRNLSGIENIDVSTSYNDKEVTLKAVPRGVLNDDKVSIQVFVLIEYQEPLLTFLPSL